MKQVMIVNQVLIINDSFDIAHTDGKVVETHFVDLSRTGEKSITDSAKVNLFMDLEPMIF